MKISKGEIIEVISEMSVLDLVELIKELEKKFEISAQAQVLSSAGPAASDGAAEDEPEEQTEFTLVLTSFNKKVEAVKEIRKATEVSLKDAMQLVGNLPATILTAASKEEVEKVKAALEAVGSKVEIK